MPSHNPSFEEIQQQVAELFRVAKRGGRARFLIPHPETGRPTYCEIDQDAALDLLADFTDEMFADPNYDWSATPHTSREAALKAAITEFAVQLGLPDGFERELTREQSYEVLLTVLHVMGLYRTFFEYERVPRRDFFKQARVLLRRLDEQRRDASSGEPVPAKAKT